MESPEQALRRAIAAVRTQQRMADLLGYKSQGTIANWLRYGQVPAKQVLAIERLTGVSRHLLRPDIYPIDPADEWKLDPINGVTHIEQRK